MFNTLAEFEATAYAFVEFLQKERGYNHVELREMSFTPEGGFSILCDFVDDFQTDLDHSERVESDKYHTLHFRTFQDLDQMKRDWPSREEREFRVLARKLTNVRGMSQHLASLAGQAFHAEIIKTLNNYRLLEAKE